MGIGRFFGATFLAIALLMVHTSGKSQPSLYTQLGMENDIVGFADTLLFDSAFLYQQYGYDGPAPLFVDAWFPLDTPNDDSLLAWQDFRKRAVPADLEIVYRVLSRRTDSCYFDGSLGYNILTGEPIAYAGASAEAVMQTVQQLGTRSQRATMRDAKRYTGQHPVIVYHHGSQASPEENYVMAEYFAVRGFVFLSSNFHWPFTDALFGLLPYALEAESKHDQSAAKCLLQFGRELAGDQPVFFMGHSWGAQEAWCFLHEPGWADAYVSMETTIEFTQDSAHIKDFWPHVYNALVTRGQRLNLPVLLLAATNEDAPFPFFERRSNGPMVFASPKEPFAHNSYTATHVLRYFYRDHLPVPDADILKTQVDLYAAHLPLIAAFLQSVIDGKPMDQELFQRLFFIN